MKTYHRYCSVPKYGNICGPVPSKVDDNPAWTALGWRDVHIKDTKPLHKCFAQRVQAGYSDATLRTVSSDFCCLGNGGNDCEFHEIIELDANSDTEPNNSEVELVTGGGAEPLFHPEDHDVMEVEQGHTTVAMQPTAHIVDIGAGLGQSTTATITGPRLSGTRRGRTVSMEVRFHLQVCLL